MNDSHIHIGQFYEEYYSPKYISDFIRKMNIDRYLVSSTTTCEENYAKVISELEQLNELDKEKAFPVLWITPKMITNTHLSYMMESKIDWKCLKIHGFIHNWPPNGKLFRQVIDLASKLQIPILIHSGGDKKCDAGSYLKVIKNYPKQIFILAHGRPIDQALEVMKQCQNAWVDTAFMPLEDIKLLKDDGLLDRVLFGTDFPITIHNEQNLSDMDWYKNRITEIVDIIGNEKFRKINEANFNKLFC